MAEHHDDHHDHAHDPSHHQAPWVVVATLLSCFGFAAVVIGLRLFLHP